MRGRNKMDLDKTLKYSKNTIDYMKEKPLPRILRIIKCISFIVVLLVVLCNFGYDILNPLKNISGIQTYDKGGKFIHSSMPIVSLIWVLLNFFINDIGKIIAKKVNNQSCGKISIYIEIIADCIVSFYYAIFAINMLIEYINNEINYNTCEWVIALLFLAAYFIEMMRLKIKNDTKYIGKEFTGFKDCNGKDIYVGMYVTYRGKIYIVIKGNEIKEKRKTEIFKQTYVLHDYKVDLFDRKEDIKLEDAAKDTEGKLKINDYIRL